MNSLQWNDLSKPLLLSCADNCSTTPENGENINSQIKLSSDRHISIPSEGSQKTQLFSRDGYDEKMKETIFSFSTLVLSNVVATVVLLIDCKPKIEYECSLLFVLSLSHTGYLFEIIKDTLTPSKDPIRMYYHRSNRLIVNTLLLILLAFASSKVDEDILILYWLMVILLFVEITSVINSLLSHSPNIFLSAFLFYLKILCAITLLYDIFRFHEDLGIWMTIVLILFILSQIIPFVGEWRRKIEKLAAHCLLIGTICYLDYSLVHDSFCRGK
jgi:hypothetical protein